MAKLTTEQEAAVTQWAAEGATLNDIQARLKRDFDLTLTYLDARLLVMDLGVSLQEKKKSEPLVAKVEDAPPDAPLDAPLGDAGWDDAPPTAASETEVIPPGGAPASGGKVAVTVDQVAVPGSMVSGRVTFSDGKTAIWYLDQFGRLGMKAPDPGYKPPAPDVPIFQSELDRALQKAGY